MVDEESLAVPAGPVRMLFHSQAPDKLPPSVLLFEGLEGFRIGIQVEPLRRPAAASQSPPPPPPPNKDNEDDRDEDTEDQSRSDRHWKRSGKDKESGDKANANKASSKPSQTKENPPASKVATFVDVVAPGTSLESGEPARIPMQQQESLPKDKFSVGSSSVPLPNLADLSTSKPAKASKGSKLMPIPFNQYGSNLSAAAAFDLAGSPPSHPASTMDLSSEGTPPHLSLNP